MTANQLADKLISSLTMEYDCDDYMKQAATMLRQQQAEIEAQKTDATKWFLKYQECFVHGIKEAK